MHRIAIIEDDSDYREFLCNTTESSGKYTLFGAYANGEAFLEAVQTAAPNDRPVLVLMDIGLPRMTGAECTRRLMRLCPTAQVMMLTVFDDTDNIYEAIIAGASAYHLKTPHKHKILEALDDLHSGGALMTGQIARKALETFRALAASPTGQTRTAGTAATNALLRILSEREHEILRLLARGDAYKKIADELHISTATVKTHIAKIYEKLHVNSRGEAAAKFFGK
jgi:DNA-binding NarL/FixJ family response regulator